jgi:acetolactate synthase-1/2/3 large subunit
MIVADYIATFLESKVKHVFMFAGGGNMYLCNSLLDRDVKPVCLHHEGALSYAVCGYAYMHNFGVGYVTSGPGSLNAVPGVAEAWVASLPCMFVSGQSPVETCLFEDRVLGVQQIDIISIIRPITKYAVVITNAQSVKFHLEEAYKEATTGRLGPVWLDVPIDVQKAEMWNDEVRGGENI